MATVAGGGKRPRRRLPLADLSNLTSSTSASGLTRLKNTARSEPCTSPSASSSTGSSPPPHAVAKVKGTDKPRKELQSSSSHLKKIKRVSKPKMMTGHMLPAAPSPPSKRTRKRTKEEQPHMEPYKYYERTKEEQPHMEPLDNSCDDSVPNQKFTEEQRAYFAEIDAFELVEEFVSSGSDLE